MINLLLGENNKYKEEYINSFILSKQKSFPDKFFVVVPEQSNLERQIALLDNESNKSKGLLNIEVSSYNHLAYNLSPNKEKEETFHEINQDYDKKKKIMITVCVAICIVIFFIIFLIALFS